MKALYKVTDRTGPWMIPDTQGWSLDTSGAQRNQTKIASAALLPWVNQGAGFFVHSTLVVEFCVLLDNCVIPLSSLLNRIVQGGKKHKQIFNVLITSSLLACASSFQHSQFKGFYSVGLKMWLLSSCKPGTALPESAFYTHWKSAPPFAKTGQAFFLNCHSVPC